MSVWRVTFKEFSDQAGFIDVLIDADDAEHAEYSARCLLHPGIHFELVGRPENTAEQQAGRAPA